MNHLHLCKLHDYVNYSNVSTEETVGSAGIRRKGRTGRRGQVGAGHWVGDKQQRVCKDLGTIYQVGQGHAPKDPECSQHLEGDTSLAERDPSMNRASWAMSSYPGPEASL